MSRKIGFWSVFAIVTGSQIGSGIFMLPASLAPYGYLSLLGWIIAACGAVSLSLVFASLCAWYPQTGGPHVYVRQAFGPTAAFFIGWTYWVISWVSTIAVIITSIGYLSPFIGLHDPLVYFIFEVAILALILMLNLRGVQAAGSIEFLLTVLKFIPLIIMPLAGLLYFNKSNLMLQDSMDHFNIFQVLGRTVLLTLWGFIGLESATAPAGSVKNPSKTIPQAVVFGTICVALLYLLNTVSILGLVPGNILMYSKAPYVDTAQLIFGGNWHFLISLVASIVCIGTFNAWTLTSSQVSLGLAQDKLLPALFFKKNRYDAPVWGLLLSSLGIVFLLLLTMHENLAQQITDVIDFSVTAFLFVYLVCSLAFLKLLMLREEQRFYHWFFGIISVVFCCWIIYETPLIVLGIASLFVVSGLPLYVFWYLRN